MKPSRLLIVGALTLCASACDKSGKPWETYTKQWGNTPEKKVAESPFVSKEELASVQKELLRAKNRIGVLESKVSSLESDAAEVLTDTPNYGLARTKFGQVTVSAEGVSPYLDGYKVKLVIGNLTSATFSGANLKVTWGFSPAQLGEKDDVSKLTEHDKEFSLTDTFPPGAFKTVEVALTPAKPEEVKYLYVQPDFNQIRMRATR